MRTHVSLVKLTPSPRVPTAAPRCASPLLTIAAALAHGRPLWVSPPPDKRGEAEAARKALAATVSTLTWAERALAYSCPQCCSWFLQLKFNQHDTRSACKCVASWSSASLCVGCLTLHNAGVPPAACPCQLARHPPLLTFLKAVPPLSSSPPCVPTPPLLSPPTHTLCRPWLSAVTTWQ
jgi:hypothetical protein